MKHVWKRLLAAMLALAMLPLMGAAEELTMGGKAYGVCLADEVRVRRLPNTDAKLSNNEPNLWFYIDEGFVAEILGEVLDGSGSVAWYKVNSTNPVPNGRTYIGYVHADYFRPMTAAETEAYLAGLGVQLPDDGGDEEEESYEDPGAPGWGTEVTDAKGLITASGVNFRKEASMDGEILAKLAEGVEVEILTIPDQIGSQYWYRVRYNGRVGFVQSNYVRVTSGGLENDAPDEEEQEPVKATGVITADGVNFRIGPGMDYGTMGKLNADTVVELLTIPDTIDANHWYCVRYNSQEGYIQSNFIRVLTLDESLLPDASVYGYAKLLQDSANLRAVPGGTTVVQWKGAGSQLRIVGEAVKKVAYLWYPVYFEKDSTIYYVRGDLIEVIGAAGGNSSSGSVPESEYGYVITTASGVNLRIKPGGESVDQVPRNTILACVGKPVSPKESGTSYTWYYVRYEGMYGYLRGDCVRVCTATGGEVAETTPPEDEPDEPVTIHGYIKLTKTGVNLRVTPLGASQIQLPRHMILPVIGEVVPAGESGRYCWYPVRTADGMSGYIRGDCAMWCDEYGNEVEEPDVPAPDEEELVGATGKLLKSSNFRKGPGTDNKIITVIKVGTVVEVLSIPANKVSGWYKIRYNGEVGYVYASLLEVLEEGELPSTGDESDVPQELMSAYVTITANQVNLRASYSTESQWRYQVNKGVVAPLAGYKTLGTVTWYNITYNGESVWVHGGYARIMTEAEFQTWAAANPSQAPEGKNLGYLKLTKDNVYIRNAAGGTTIVDQLPIDTVVPYYTEAIKTDDFSWYRIQTPGGKYGYIRADMVDFCDENGDELQKPGIGSTDSAPDSQQETSYSELRLGDSGVKVANLVAELINQGYYTGTQTSDFTSAVQAAVKAFQSVNGLTVDGIAGSKTQHKLFGTQPIGSGDTTNLDFTIYPVEKIDWFTGGIQELLPRGANFKVYDVKTGIVWWAHRWAGSKHADIETLTAADSARLCQIYGVKNLAEIVTENMWERRPCLVTIGTRTFACSLDGMQHNPDGDTISNNNMDGQICLHFTNSTGHSPNAPVSTSHAEAIEYAYNNCPAGQKK